MENIKEIVSKPVRIKLRNSDNEVVCRFIFPTNANWHPKGFSEACIKIRLLKKDSFQDTLIPCNDVEMVKYS